MQSASRYLLRERQQSISGYGKVLAIWGAILGTSAFVAALYVSLHCYLSVPFEDHWAVIEELFHNNGTYSLKTLWSLHNEHRLPLTKLLIMTDLYWFRGQNISLFIEIYLVQVLHWAALVWAMRQGALWPRWIVAVGGGLAGFSLFWTTQFQSFLNTFGLQVIPAAAFGTMGFVALLFAHEQEKRHTMWFGLALVSAAISEVSSANGLLLWPLFLLVAIRFRFSRVHILILVVVGAICTAAYLIGYVRPGGHANPSESIDHLSRLAQYVLIYLGCIWGSLNLVMGEIFAAIGSMAVLACFAFEFFRARVKPFAFTMLSICIFLLGTGFITALGRINFPLIQATSSRYQTSALLFWLCFALYLIDSAYRARMRYALLASASCLMFATAVLPSFPSSLEGAEEMRSRISSAALPVFADVKDNSVIAKIMFSPESIFEERPFLKQHHTAFYADSRYELLGQQVESKFQVATQDRCLGAFDSSRRISDAKFPGWELRGWVWDHKAQHPASQIIAVSQKGVISGVGEVGLMRGDVANVYREIVDPRVGWHLYLQGGDQQDVKVYGIVDGGKTVCLAAPPFSVPKP